MAIESGTGIYRKSHRLQIAQQCVNTSEVRKQFSFFEVLFNSMNSKTKIFVITVENYSNYHWQKLSPALIKRVSTFLYVWKCSSKISWYRRDSIEEKTFWAWVQKQPATSTIRATVIFKTERFWFSQQFRKAKYFHTIKIESIFFHQFEHPTTKIFNSWTGWTSSHPGFRHQLLEAEFSLCESEKWILQYDEQMSSDGDHEEFANHTMFGEWNVNRNGFLYQGDVTFLASFTWNFAHCFFRLNVQREQAQKRCSRLPWCRTTSYYLTSSWSSNSWW